MCHYNPLFEVHLCTVTFGLIYGQYSRLLSNQERVIGVIVTILKPGRPRVPGKSYCNHVTSFASPGYFHLQELSFPFVYQESALTDLKMKIVLILQCQYRMYSLVFSHLKGLTHSLMNRLNCKERRCLIKVLALLLFCRFCALHPQWDQNIFEGAFCNLWISAVLAVENKVFSKIYYIILTLNQFHCHRTHACFREKGINSVTGGKK